MQPPSTPWHHARPYSSSHSSGLSMEARLETQARVETPTIGTSQRALVEVE